ncbi:MAG: hypothetical protein HUJ56_09660, partial [Erysipelotrichaceae bacterium]|nr:hypothetical protein [Erysipelotrichaceae bacterium]
MQWFIQGMNRDISVSKYDSKFAYEIKNLRINAIDDNTTLSWTSEKGTRLITMDNDIKGTPIGCTTISDYIVVFTHASDSGGPRDYIYLLSNLEISETICSIKVRNIFGTWGNIGFDFSHPLETLPIYENENAIKVYWVDGINPPRVINIAKAIKDPDFRYDRNDDKNFTQFDFISNLRGGETITVGKTITSSGFFAPGVIQYVFTYFNKFGSETNIFAISPLNYISYNNRGASPEDIVGVEFTINVSNIDKGFDYLRIYSIHRSSLDATPYVKRVVDLSIEDSVDASTQSSITFVDNGSFGDVVDPTVLLYVGGKDIIAGTICQKDNTLFLGNISTRSQLINNIIKEYDKE